MALQLWRAKWLMFLVFMPIGLTGLAITLLAPTKYVASTRLFVRLGQEHLLDPQVGEMGRGGFAQQEAVLRAETELARSPVIAERVLAGIGPSRLYPSLGPAKLRARDGADLEIGQDVLDAFAGDLEISAASRSSILRLTYAHPEPELAAATLNRLVAEYLRFRNEALTEKAPSVLAQQRDVIENRLAVADRLLRDYLTTGGLSDFEVEYGAARTALSDLSEELAKVEASLREAEAKSAGLTRQMTVIPKDVDLYVETTSEQDLLSLRLERENLLARYLPDSRIVQDIDRRIAQLATFLKTAPMQGLRRVGPNPTWKALEADKSAQAANISALLGRSAALAKQKREAEARIIALADLEPHYLKLKRERDALATSASAFSVREQAEGAGSEAAARSVDNILVYEAARAPLKVDARMSTIALVAALLGLATALVAGLLRAWSVKSFPTAGSIERTLRIRVLAAARDRSR